MVRLARALSVGAWLTGLTVTAKVRVMMLLMVPPSLTVTLMVAEPKPLATGAKVMEPVVLGLVSLTAGISVKPGLLEEVVTVNVWLSLAAPEVMPERLMV